MIGSALAHYRILGPLGKGGMGEVFVAEDTRLKRRVALKVLSGEMAEDPQSLARFQREAESLAALSHPSIVTIHSVEEAEGVRFLTMELVEGRPLSELIPEGGLTLERLLDVAIPLASGLAAAHEAGIVHRDLKPTNVLITGDGRVKILDFGIAKPNVEVAAPDDAVTEPQGLTRAGQILGTVPYMSPEQLRGRALDHRSDIFSLGVMLHEMTTGERPFAGDTSVEVMSSILRDLPESVIELKPDLPNHLARIIGRCLDKNPDQRFQSTRDLWLELEGLREETATGIARPRTRERRPVAPEAPARGRRFALAGAAVAGLLVLIALAAVFVPRGETRPDLKTVAVLPFRNLTGDPGQDYLSEGIGAGLINQLSEVAGVRVVGRSEAWGRAASGAGVRELASRLGAGSVVDGDIQRQGGRLQVSVQLTEAETGMVLWSERFEGEREKLFELQGRIARRLADVLAIPLSRRELDRLARDPTRSLEAYEYFLKGLEQAEEARDSSDLALAAELYRQALRLDPEFALAHAGLSEVLWRSYQQDRVRQKLDRAAEHAQRAIELDPELPSAQVAMARMSRETGHQADSIATLEALLARHPKPDEAQREIAVGYEQVGRLDEAEAAFRAAVALADDRWINWYRLGTFLARHGRYGDAREALERAAEMAPAGVTWPAENLANLELVEGNFDAAVEAFERLPRPIRDGRLATNIGTAYYYSSRPDKWEQAEKHYLTAVRLTPNVAVRQANLGDLYLKLGRREQAQERFRTARRLADEEIETNPGDHRLLLASAVYAAKSEDCETAVSRARLLADEMPATGPGSLMLAKVYAVCGERAPALAAIRAAIDQGEAPERVAQDEEFSSLRDDPEFRALTEG